MMAKSAKCQVLSAECAESAPRLPSTTQHSALSTPHLLSALQHQAECYGRLAKLAAAQREHVQQGRSEALLEVLQLRQLELNEAGRLEQEIGPARRNWAQTAATMPSADRAQAEELMRNIRQLLERITAADRDDVLALQQRKLSIGRQINQTRSAGRVNQHYAAAAYGRPVSRMDVGG